MSLYVPTALISVAEIYFAVQGLSILLLLALIIVGPLDSLFPSLGPIISVIALASFFITLLSGPLYLLILGLYYTLVLLNTLLSQLCDLGHRFASISSNHFQRRRQQLVRRPRQRRWTSGSTNDGGFAASESSYESSCYIDELCDHCEKLPRSPGTFSVSCWMNTSWEEEHDLGIGLAELRESATSSSCHLCSVLWFSLDPDDVAMAETSRPMPESHDNRNMDLERQPLLSACNSTLTVRVSTEAWAEFHPERVCRIRMQLFHRGAQLGSPVVMDIDTPGKSAPSFVDKPLPDRVDRFLPCLIPTSFLVPINSGGRLYITRASDRIRSQG